MYLRRVLAKPEPEARQKEDMAKVAERPGTTGTVPTHHFW